MDKSINFLKDKTLNPLAGLQKDKNFILFLLHDLKNAHKKISMSLQFSLKKIEKKPWECYS